MVAISKHEFFQMLKSIKSILVFLFLLGVTYAGIKVADEFGELFQLPPTETDMLYTVGLSMAVMVFGPLFVLTLSHDVFNREISGRMMRFLVTKTKRRNIVLGKFFGILLFWFAILLASYGLIFMLSGTISYQTFFESLSILMVFIGMATVLSLLVNKPMLSMFLGVLAGIVFPAISLWSIVSESMTIKWFRFFTPYYYLSKEGTMLFLVNFGMAALLVLISIILFRGRDV